MSAPRNHGRGWSDQERAQLLHMRAGGASCQEIAKALSRTAGAVAIQLHRARFAERMEAAIRESLAKEQAPPPPPRVVWSRSYFWGLFRIEKIQEHGPRH